MSRYSFRPPLWSWPLVAALSALMISLGLWQYHRGQDKEGLQQRYQAAAAGSAQPLQAGEAPQAGQMHKRSVSGSYLAQQQLLLDNQSLKHRPGYHAWTPLRREDGSLVMVDRGWLPADADRSRLPSLPAPEGPVTVEGYWRPLPEPGLRVDDRACAASGFPRLVQYPRQEELRCLYPGERVAPGLLLLSPEAAGGFERSWDIGVEVPPAKHYGYALQWFAFTATLLVLFIKLNLKRRHEQS
ncbi:MAG TPA: SURF1 family protein [Solimonas sp.]|nr:SURF1 family protein [Solimonas sp.]